MEGSATDPGTAPVLAPTKPSDWLGQAATALGALAGLAILGALVGGIVMWLRFDKAGLPANQAVAVMPRAETITIGIEALVVPALASGALALGLVLAAGLGDLIKSAIFWIGVLLSALVFFCVPFPVTSVAWLSLWLIVVYWRRGLRRVPRDSAKLPSPLGLVLIVMLVAAIISLGRQVVDPVGLQSLTITATGLERPATGVLVARTADAVYLGDLQAKRIRVFRADAVKRLSIGAPLQDAPPSSLLSHVVGGGAWSIVPLAIWCDGIRYGLNHLGTACRTQPRLVAKKLRADLRWLPIKVTCPDDAGTDGCSGYARIRSVQRYGAEALGPTLSARQVETPARGRPGVRFRVAAGSETVVCVPATAKLRYLLSTLPAEGDKKPATHVPMTVLLTTDAQGRSVLRRTAVKLDVATPGTDPSLVPDGPCSADYRRSLQHPPPSTGPARTTAKLVEVVDGDTLDVVDGDGTPLEVRIIGIDAAERRHGEACGEAQARRFVAREIPASRDLVLEADRGIDDRDRSSRLLRYVWARHGGRTINVGEQEVRRGWARSPPAPGSRFARSASHAAAARTAQRHQRGRWAVCRDRMDDGMTPGPVPGE